MEGIDAQGQRHRVEVKGCKCASVPPAYRMATWISLALGFFILSPIFNLYAAPPTRLWMGLAGIVAIFWYTWQQQQQQPVPVPLRQQPPPPAIPVPLTVHATRDPPPQLGFAAGEK